MRLVVYGIAAAVVLILLGQQLLIPRHLEGEIEQRLERGGGSAEVTLRSWPAFDLLRSRGDDLRVKGSGLAFGLVADRAVSLDRLDGFARVAIELEDVNAGPLKVDSFTMARSGRDEEEYDLTVFGRTTPREVARELGTTAGGALGGLLGSLAGEVLPGGATEVPFQLRAAFRSVGGRAQLVRADGSVAGVPAGPLTELVVRAVVERL